MSITINRRRPSGIPDGYVGDVRWNVNAKTRASRKLKTDFPTSLAISQTVGRIMGAFEALSSVHAEGSVNILITPDKTQLTGEMTVYDPEADSAVNHVLQLVDGASFSLRREFGSCIEQIEITLELTCECTPA